MGPSWSLSEDDILVTPLDHLAMHVVRDWVETEQWNFQNWLYTAHAFSRRSEVALALAEALNWLVTEGLIARGIPGQSSSDAGFVTRLGNQALREGMEALRTLKRLSVDLHPRLEKVRTQYLLGEYELAAFAAMREVEISVRDLAGADESLVGVNSGQPVP